ncbi:hypothetical protein FI667_g4830, partial [Globisporangium splendens]
MDHIAHVIASKVEAEYALENERKRALLARCGVAEEDLSKNGQVYLHVLSEVAELLEIKDTNASSFLLAMSDLEDALYEAEAQARTLRTAADASHARSQELTAQWNELELVQRQLETTVGEREENGNSENTATMEQRTEEYKERQCAAEAELVALQTKLTAVGFDASAHDKYLLKSVSCVDRVFSSINPVDSCACVSRMGHQSISDLEQVFIYSGYALLVFALQPLTAFVCWVLLNQECDAIDAQNRALREQLRMYHDLPLSKDVAAAQLMDAKAELQRLEDQFSAQIREML